MKRIRIVGLCLVAMFAMSALAATAAHAGEYGVCKKAEPKNTGNYSDKNCQIKVGGTGGWEWYPAGSPQVPTPIAYTDSTKTAELVGAAGVIKCKKSTSSGAITGPKSDIDVVRFTGCEFIGAVKGECHSAGEPAGNITTNVLNTKLIDHGEKGFSGGEPAEGEVWTEFYGPGGPETVQAEYECAKLLVIRTEGSLSGKYTKGSINVMSKKAETEFNGVLGESPGKFGEQDLFSEASIGGGPFEPVGQGIEKTKGKTKNSVKLEIKS